MNDERDELAAVVIDMNLCERNDHPPDPDPDGECCACGMVVYQWPDESPVSFVNDERCDRDRVTDGARTNQTGDLSVPLDEQLAAALEEAGFDETDTWNAIEAVMPVLRINRPMTFYRDRPPKRW